METLFPTRNDFHVLRLTDEDARRRTHSLLTLEEQLRAGAEMYPNIVSWFRTRVVPGIRDGSRAAYIAFEGDTPVITAIVKISEHAKFCHLRIANDFQDMNLGELFFSIMALEVRTTAREIHFTLPEGLWYRRLGFFKSFGFRDVTRATTQYRLFEEELRTSAPFWDVWRAARQRLPKLQNAFSINSYSMSPALMLSVKPAFTSKVLSGQKTVEIRRRFHPRWRGSRVALYASSPDRALVGEATIQDIHSASPSEIWGRFGPQIGCSEADFLAYVGEQEKVFAIQLCDVSPYSAKLPVCQFEYLLEEGLTPPQSYCNVRSNEQWNKAVSIAALLHSCHRASAPPLNTAVL